MQCSLLELRGRTFRNVGAYFLATFQRPHNLSLQVRFIYMVFNFGNACHRLIMTQQF